MQPQVTGVNSEKRCPCPKRNGNLTNIADHAPRHAKQPFQQKAHSHGTQQVAISSLEAVRKQHKSTGVSEKASDFIESGWSKGTNVAYQSAWSKWSSWCHEQQVDPISCEIHFIVNFLAELYAQGLQQQSINTIRSAVSMTHSQIEGIPVGQHPLVSRLMKGIYNCRPPQPRYTATWDVDIVTTYIQSLGANAALSLKQLSQKLAMLMVLVEASRTSELGALDIRY